MKRLKSAEPSIRTLLPLHESLSDILNPSQVAALPARAIAAVAGAKASSNTTARRAAEVLLGKKLGFVIPTPKQKKNLVVAFAKRDMIVYGKAFDIVRLSGQVNLNDLSGIEQNLERVTLYEIKSTSREVDNDFRGYFFAVTAAELLVSQSLKSRFKFVFVDINTRNHVELSLSQMFARAKGIYPTWSILF
ncbi:MAG TPA: hypothetical protein VFZ08_13550 [Terriglobia bacterium]|nr:hypothetical protein [Terriglobia bacterium]